MSAAAHQIEPEPIARGQVAGARLNAHSGGRLFVIPVHCYAVSGPYVYVHISEPWSPGGLREQPRVLLAVDDMEGLPAGCPCRGWGTLERAKDDDLAPHVARMGGACAQAPIWRVRLDSLERGPGATNEGAR